MALARADDVPAEPPPPSVRARLNRSMMPVLIALSAALITVAVLIAQTFDAERAAREQTIRETETLFALQALLRTALDAESGQRGYLLTGRAEYLMPYTDAKSRYLAKLAEVRVLVDRAPTIEQARHARALDAAVRAKMDELGLTVALAARGERARALRVVVTGVGRAHMGTIRQEVNWLAAAETRKRDDAIARVIAIEQRVVVLASVLGIAILALVVLGFRGEGARARAAAVVEQATALSEANARAQLLARELNHRVKNLFSIILAIVSLSGRKRGSAAEVVEDIRARIRALSLAHTISQGSVSDEEVRLGEVIARTMDPYREPDAERVRIAGPDQAMTVRGVTPVGLIVHELATNAVKYGALSNAVGTVAITWSVRQSGNIGKELELCWIESGGPALSCSPFGPDHAGYGSQMIALAANQLGGTVEREWPESGVIVRVRFPVA